MEALSDADAGVRRGEEFCIVRARLAAGKMVLRTKYLKNPGFKGPAAYLAEALGGKWVHRDHGYQLTPDKMTLWKQLHAAGWDGHPAWYRGNTHTFSHAQITDGEARPRKFSLSELRQYLRKQTV